MKITTKDMILAFSIGTIGFILSTPFIIKWVNINLNPITGTLFIYGITFGVIYLFSLFGLTIGKFRIDGLRDTLGMFFILVAFFTIIGWQSPLANIVIYGSDANVAQHYFFEFDGLLWFLFLKVTDNIMILRILTYVVIPSLLAFTGGWLMRRKPKLGL